MNSIAKSNTSFQESITEEEMSTTVTAKGQVTIPKAVRDMLGIGPGSQVDFRRMSDGNVVLVPVDTQEQASRFGKFRGHAGKGMSTDEIMALTRGED
ncbi:AbrB family looped-hinge helix DNA binding protein [Rhizobium sp. BK347]|nr:AbrB family looped-hinge helix DNA binding protein [Rhizobium sp. BK252]MBB3401335.1 AbrB family looped-hinge helix DNA binding protein [Rhizobium sp. BK289]MBB3413913.1 AbrB family looped-hinge helix DNA binding protein [Rhizobium sp. BK284]MBB3481800.1 AbrB family looped-hinge helix DNA binding protein [Rhizobium sp. BK347]